MIYTALNLELKKFLTLILSIKFSWTLLAVVTYAIFNYNDATYLNQENSDSIDRNYWSAILIMPILESILICIIYNISRLIFGTIAFPMIIVAFCFSLLHLHNSVWQSITTIQSGFIYALAFEYFRIRTNSLAAIGSISIIHSFYNSVVTSPLWLFELN